MPMKASTKERRITDAAVCDVATTRRTRRVPPAPAIAIYSPRARAVENRLAVLALANRFRQVRVLDVAAGVFAERGFKAALSAAQRAVGRLVRDRMLTRYRSLSGQTYYGLAKRGADLLRETLAPDAEPSASRACEKTNPEHALWAAFAVLCCEARGLLALTEHELTRQLKAEQGRRHPLTYPSGDSVAKGLIPDAIAFQNGGVVWFEIDRSARGSARADDLIALVARMGHRVNTGREQPPLRRIVVWCKTPGILRRNRTHLRGPVNVNGEQVPRLRAGLPAQPALRPVGDDVYEVLRDVEVRLSDGRVAVQTVVAGQLHLQLLPSHLLSYSYRDGPPAGWFDDGSLPFRALWKERPPSQSGAR